MSNHYAEITEKAFYAIVGYPCTRPTIIEELELCFINHYYHKGVGLKIIHNYIGGITQYYIQDINA